MGIASTFFAQLSILEKREGRARASVACEVVLLDPNSWVEGFKTR
jgi:hypothetical protein